MNLFLRAKHWHLFVLTFGIPIVLEMIFILSVFSRFLSNPGTPQDVGAIFGYFRFFPFIMLLFMGGLLGWQWSVAVGLQKIVPATVKMKVKKFKIFFFIPVSYLSLLMIFLFFVFSMNFSNPNNIGAGFFISFAVIFPLHLFSVFCLFYCIYFVSKTIKTVELQKEVTFADFALEFFLVWFFPIGVWILQPKINKMVEEYNAQPLS
jgi:hypothetical protein